MSTKTSTKAKSKSGTSSTRPPSRATRRNPTVEDEIPDEGDPTPPGGIPGDAETPVPEGQQPSLTDDPTHHDTNSRQGASSTGATAGTPDVDTAAGGTTGHDDSSAMRPSTTSRSPSADDASAPRPDILNGLRQEVNAIVREADEIFKGLNEQIKGSFDSAARAEGYLQ